MNNHFDTIVTLKTVTRTQDSDGYPVETETASVVWGDLRSAARTEFYSAEAQGHKIAYVLSVPFVDYNDAEKASIDGKDYAIVRSYRKTLDIIELSLERI